MRDTDASRLYGLTPKKKDSSFSFDSRDTWHKVKSVFPISTLYNICSRTSSKKKSLMLIACEGHLLVGQAESGMASPLVRSFDGELKCFGSGEKSEQDCLPI